MEETLENPVPTKLREALSAKIEEEIKLKENRVKLRADIGVIKIKCQRLKESLEKFEERIEDDFNRSRKELVRYNSTTKKSLKEKLLSLAGNDLKAALDFLHEEQKPLERIFIGNQTIEPNDWVLLRKGFAPKLAGITERLKNSIDERNKKSQTLYSMRNSLDKVKKIEIDDGNLKESIDQYKTNIKSILADANRGLEEIIKKETMRSEFLENVGDLMGMAPDPNSITGEATTLIENIKQDIGDINEEAPGAISSRHMQELIVEDHTTTASRQSTAISETFERINLQTASTEKKIEFLTVNLNEMLLQNEETNDYEAVMSILEEFKNNQYITQVISDLTPPDRKEDIKLVTHYGIIYLEEPVVYLPTMSRGPSKIKIELVGNKKIRDGTSQYVSNFDDADSIEDHTSEHGSTTDPDVDQPQEAQPTNGEPDIEQLMQDGDAMEEGPDADDQSYEDTSQSNADFSLETTELEMASLVTFKNAIIEIIESQGQNGKNRAPSHDETQAPAIETQPSTIALRSDIINSEVIAKNSNLDLSHLHLDYDLDYDVEPNNIGIECLGLTLVGKQEQKKVITSTNMTLEIQGDCTLQNLSIQNSKLVLMAALSETHTSTLSNINFHADKEFIVDSSNPIELLDSVISSSESRLESNHIKIDHCTLEGEIVSIESDGHCTCENTTLSSNKIEFKSPNVTLTNITLGEYTQLNFADARRVEVSGKAEQLSSILKQSNGNENTDITINLSEIKNKEELGLVLESLKQCPCHVMCNFASLPESIHGVEISGDLSKHSFINTPSTLLLKFKDAKLPELTENNQAILDCIGGSLRPSSSLSPTTIMPVRKLSNMTFDSPCKLISNPHSELTLSDFSTRNFSVMKTTVDIMGNKLRALPGLYENLTFQSGSSGSQIAEGAIFGLNVEAGVRLKITPPFKMIATELHPITLKSNSIDVESLQDKIMLCCDSKEATLNIDIDLLSELIKHEKISMDRTSFSKVLNILKDKINNSEESKALIEGLSKSVLLLDASIVSDYITSFLNDHNPEFKNPDKPGRYTSILEKSAHLLPEEVALLSISCDAPNSAVTRVLPIDKELDQSAVTDVKHREQALNQIKQKTLAIARLKQYFLDIKTNPSTVIDELSTRGALNVLKIPKYREQLTSPGRHGEPAFINAEHIDTLRIALEKSMTESITHQVRRSYEPDSESTFFQSLSRLTIEDKDTLFDSALQSLHIITPLSTHDESIISTLGDEFFSLFENQENNKRDDDALQPHDNDMNFPTLSAECAYDTLLSYNPTNEITDTGKKKLALKQGLLATLNEIIQEKDPESHNKKMTAFKEILLKLASHEFHAATLIATEKEFTSLATCIDKNTFSTGVFGNGKFEQTLLDAHKISHNSTKGDRLVDRMHAIKVKIGESISVKQKLKLLSDTLREYEPSSASHKFGRVKKNFRDNLKNALDLIENDTVISPKIKNIVLNKTQECLLKLKEYDLIGAENSLSKIVNALGPTNEIKGFTRAKNILSDDKKIKAFSKKHSRSSCKFHQTISKCQAVFNSEPWLAKEQAYHALSACYTETKSSTVKHVQFAMRALTDCNIDHKIDFLKAIRGDETLDSDHRFHSLVNDFKHTHSLTDDEKKEIKAMQTSLENQKRKQCELCKVIGKRYKPIWKLGIGETKKALIDSIIELTESPNPIGAYNVLQKILETDDKHVMLGTENIDLKLLNDLRQDKNRRSKSCRAHLEAMRDILAPICNTNLKKLPARPDKAETSRQAIQQAVRDAVNIVSVSAKVQNSPDRQESSVHEVASDKPKSTLSEPSDDPREVAKLALKGRRQRQTQTQSKITNPKRFRSH